MPSDAVVSQITWQIGTSDIISLIALIVSIVFAVMSIGRTRKEQYKQFEADYFTKVFHEYLMEVFPDSLNRLFVQNSDDEEIKQRLIDDIVRFNKALQYFYYADKKFYDELKDSLQDAENYLTTSMNKPAKNASDKIDFQEGIKKRMEKIYTLVSKRYRR